MHLPALPVVTDKAILDEVFTHISYTGSSSAPFESSPDAPRDNTRLAVSAICQAMKLGSHWSYRLMAMPASKKWSSTSFGGPIQILLQAVLR